MNDSIDFDTMVTNTDLNPLPMYVDEVGDYSKINLTTIHDYKVKRAVRPQLNLSVAGRINNIKDDYEFIRRAASNLGEETRTLTTTIKDFKIEMLEEKAMMNMVLDIHRCWTKIRTSIDDHQKEYSDLDVSIDHYRKRFGRIGQRLNSRTSFNKILPRGLWGLRNRSGLHLRRD